MSGLVPRSFFSDPFIVGPSYTRDTLFGNIETIFNDVFNGMISQKSKLLDNVGGYPRMDIFVKDNKYCIQVACAGLTESDIDVKVSEGILTISGSKLEKHEDAKYLSKSLTRSAFTKHLTIPEDVEGDPTATMENGLLTLMWNLKVPVKQVPQQKKIAINATNRSPPPEISA